jgi:hypothetical protein
MELNKLIKNCIDKKYTKILINNHCDKNLILSIKKYSNSILTISYRRLKNFNLKILYEINIIYLDTYNKLELNNYIKSLYYIMNNDISYFNNSLYNISIYFIIKLFKNVVITNNKIELKIMIKEYESFNNYTNYIIESLIKLKYNKYILYYKICRTTEEFIYTGIFE